MRKILDSSSCKIDLIAMIRNSIVEISKLARTYGYIFSTSFRAAKGSPDARQFMTELYLSSLEKQSRIPVKSAYEVFPEIGNVEFKVFSKGHARLAGGFDKRESLTTPYELCVLSAITKVISPNRIFEFGTFKGGTTYQFFLNSNSTAEIFTLDKNALLSKDGSIREAFEGDRIHAFTSDSTSFDFEPFVESIDLIFIDGGHDLETVTADTQNAFKISKDGGVILWHDYKPDHLGVFDFINELGGSKNLVHIEGTSLVAYCGNSLHL